MVSFDEYIEHMKEKQPGIYYITGESLEAVRNAPFLEKLKKKGYEVLFMVDAIDEYAMQQLKEYKEKKFICVTKENMNMEDDDEEKKALEVLMDCLVIHQQDVERCIAVLQLLVTILFMSVQQGEGVSKRIVETAVFIMNNYSDSEAIQKLGIEMLEAFVSQEGDLMSFLGLGGLDVVLRAMRGSSETLRISCSKLLVAAAKNERKKHEQEETARVFIPIESEN